MSEPKHIPLPKRWSDDFHQFVQDRADALEEWVVRVVLDLVPHPIKAVLEAADDAHEIETEDREPCAWLVYSNGLTAPSEYCDDFAEQGSPYCTYHTTLLENR